MADLYFSHRPLEEALNGIIIKHGIDLIVTSRFIFNNPVYEDIKNILSSQDIPVRQMSGSLTLEEAENFPREPRFQSLLVVGGGRLVDFFKVVCGCHGGEMTILLTNLSNDGFASGCSALPAAHGKDFVTINSREPEAVYVFQELLKKMPLEFILSGLGEAISKLQVMEDLRFEKSQTEIDHIFCLALEALYDLLFREFTILDYNDPEFLFRLTTALYQYSLLMSQGSDLCSRSEHEFEKACVMHGINLRHGILVLLGAMVSMKIRQSHESFRDKDPAIFTYNSLLKVIVKFKLTEHIRESLEVLDRNLEDTTVLEGLRELSRMRPERIGLWNFVESRHIDWKELFKSLDQDLREMNCSPAKRFQEVLEH